MARRLSIFLLLIFVFHVGGYYFINMTWRQLARASMAKRIELEHYSANETVTIKVPFTPPYPSGWGTFEPLKGEFEHLGDFYKLVKQKLENDTLYVVAIKDAKEKAIFNLMTQFVKASSEHPTTPGALKLLNTFTKDYVSSENVTIVSQNGWSSKVFSNHQYPDLIEQLKPVDSPPPDHSS